MLKYSKTGQDLRKVQVFEVPIFIGVYHRSRIQKAS